MNWEKRRIFNYVLVLFFAALACGLPFEISEFLPAEEEISDGAEIPAEEEIVKPSAPGAGNQVQAMAFVVDPHYQPISHAAIGTNRVRTDRYGVAVGEIHTNQAGWVPVRAAGYVTNYARPVGFQGKYDLYFVTLVPLDACGYYDGTSEVSLWLGERDARRLQVGIPPGALDGKEAMLELTEIQVEQVRLDDAWAELDPEYTPLISFDISAFDMEGEEVKLGEDTPVVVRIPDEEHDMDDLVLQSFNPASGRWIIEEDACSRVDEETIQCALAHFSLHSYMEGYLGPEELGSVEADDFRDAYHKMGAVLDEVEESGQLDNGNAEKLSNQLERLAKAAKDFAEKNRNEAGKAMLMYAYQAAISSGAPGGQAIAQDLLAKAQELTAEMAKEMAQDADCGNMHELTNLAEQAMLLGGPAQDQVQPLLDKIKDRFDNCVIWKGTIHYMFFLLEDFPGLEGEWSLDSGTSTWHEIHDVTIAINPLTGHLDGDSQVKLNMPTASYVNKMGPGDCGYEKHWIDLETAPAGGSVWLTFEGSYHDPAFTISSIQEKESEPVRLINHTHGKFFGEDCNVEEREFGSFPMFPYRSQLLDAFYGSPQPPSLQDMLNSGTRRIAGKLETIRGSQGLSYSAGTNRSPVLPIDRGHVSWSFVREVEAGED